MKLKTWGVPHQALDVDNNDAVTGTGQAWDVALGCRDPADRTEGCTPGEPTYYDIAANAAVQLAKVTDSDPRTCPDTGYVKGGVLPVVRGDAFCVRTTDTTATVVLIAASTIRPLTKPTTVEVSVEIRTIRR